MLLGLTTTLVAVASAGPPDYTDKAGTARWMAHTLNWGVLATASVHLGNKFPFSNANSHADAGDGRIFFYTSSMDTSMQDVAADPRVSFTLSEAQKPGMCMIGTKNVTAIAASSFKVSDAPPDPEDPTCARLTFSGTFRKTNASETPAAKAALFARHPQMKAWPSSHEFYFATIDISAIWLIDYYGGAADIKPEDYYAHAPVSATSTVAADAPLPARAKATWTDGPGPGPRDKAFCPVTGQNVTITAATPALEFKNGQKLFFSSDAAVKKYRTSPRDYWLAPHDKPLPPPDGMRGLPDLRGTILHCPRSNETMNVSMQTPRVVHKHGQAVYFCCFGCVTAFWTDPTSVFA